MSPCEESDKMRNNPGIADESPWRAALKASARTLHDWRPLSPYHALICRSAHVGLLSRWQMLHAFGMPCRTVFSGTGMLNEWSRMRVLRLRTVAGMWHSTQELPKLCRLWWVCLVISVPIALWHCVHSALF
jgi:hypothetical protein